MSTVQIIQTITVILIFLIGIYGLKILKSKFHKSFNFRVLTALGGGLLFGIIIQLIFGAEGNVTNNSSIFMSIFSGAYINLLELIVIPLILVSITTAIIDAGEKAKVGRKISQVIGVLLVTVMIAATIGIGTITLFNVDGEAIVNSAENTTAATDKEKDLTSKQSDLGDKNYADFILAPVSTNFGFLVGDSQTAALSTVLFGMFLGYSTIQIKKRKPEKAKAFLEVLYSLKEIVLSMVREILKLTPFGIFALMSKFAATSAFGSLAELGKFVIATYTAILIMYLVHLLIITIQGLSPTKFMKKTWPVLLFGFGSRSSMGALPMNIETQTKELGVDETSASLSASFGATIGQNGCAGIYPAMLATMAAGIVGTPITLGWCAMLIVVIAISSFGIAGVGGGATFAAIAVLSIMGLPIEIAATLVAVEPLLDMARTALNISDAMVTGVTVSNINKELNKEEYSK